MVVCSGIRIEDEAKEMGIKAERCEGIRAKTEECDPGHEWRISEAIIGDLAVTGFFLRVVISHQVRNDAGHSVALGRVSLGHLTLHATYPQP